MKLSGTGDWSNDHPGQDDDGLSEVRYAVCCHGSPDYPTAKPFDSAPLPWRYDAVTRNVVAADGAIVCRIGDSVYGDPALGETIVRQFNALGFTRQL